MSVILALQYVLVVCVMMSYALLHLQKMGILQRIVTVCCMLASTYMSKRNRVSIYDTVGSIQLQCVHMSQFYMHDWVMCAFATRL